MHARRQAFEQLVVVVAVVVAVVVCDPHARRALSQRVLVPSHLHVATPSRWLPTAGTMTTKQVKLKRRPASATKVVMIVTTVARMAALAVPMRMTLRAVKGVQSTM